MAQLPTHYNPKFQKFDSLIGLETTSLYNGVEYVQKYVLSDEGKHPYYRENIFSDGAISYDGRYFPNVPLKLNLYEDELIANIDHRLSKGEIRLIKSKVNKFYLFGKEFVFLKFTVDNTPFEGFCEILFESEHVVLFKKRNKKRYRVFKEGLVSYEFERSNDNIIMKFVDGYHHIKNPGDLKNVHPQFKEIYKTHFNKRLYRNNRDPHLISLSKRMNEFYLIDQTRLSNE